MMTRPDPEKFRTSIHGKETSLHFLNNRHSVEVAITNYGARIVAVVVPGNNRQAADVVVGFDSIQGYLSSKETYHGAVVGRYANRIANGRFSLNGKEYHVAINNPPNHLHGGLHGFNQQVWKVEETSGNMIRLSYFSEDGEENYPGNLTVTVTYTLTDKNELIIAYKATSDQDTVLNLTAHPYFNLNGQGNGTIENHMLQINAANFTPVDDTLIPTRIAPVEQTPFDFRTPKRIGQDIAADDQQLTYGSGYDHNFVLNGEGLCSAATAMGDKTGIAMEVLTDQPGIQLYTGNHLKGENATRDGTRDNYRESFCLETQHFPDSPNHPEFPSTVLKVGEEFRSTTIYRFYTQD